MNTFYTHILATVLGFLIAVMLMESCGKTKPQHEIITKIQRDTIIERVYYPELSGKAKSVLKYTYAPKENHIVDTNKLITTNDAVQICDTIASFVATLDTIQLKDTLHLEFTYPSAMFSYKLNRQADSVRIVNTTIEKTITIPPNPFSFGVQTGIGYLQSFRTGQNAFGWYVGFGIGYKL